MITYASNSLKHIRVSRYKYNITNKRLRVCPIGHYILYIYNIGGDEVQYKSLFAYLIPDRSRTEPSRADYSRERQSVAPSIAVVTVYERGEDITCSLSPRYRLLSTGNSGRRTDDDRIVHLLSGHTHTDRSGLVT